MPESAARYETRSRSMFQRCIVTDFCRNLGSVDATRDYEPIHRESALRRNNARQTIICQFQLSDLARIKNSR